MDFLKTIANRALLNEAQQYDEVISNPQEISKLTQVVVNALKKTTQDVSSLQMAQVTKQARTTIDESFKSQQVTLSSAQIEQLTKSVLAELQKNSSAYKLYENSDPTWQFANVNGNDVKIAELAQAVITRLKADNGDIGALPKAAFNEQTRAVLDESFISKGASLTSDELNTIAEAVTTEMVSKAIDYLV